MGCSTEGARRGLATHKWVDSLVLEALRAADGLVCVEPNGDLGRGAGAPGDSNSRILSRIEIGFPAEEVELCLEDSGENFARAC